MISEELYVKEDLKIEIRERISYNITKRFIDVILALAGLSILVPLFLIVAIIIKIDDPNGPIVFSQIRVGKNGELFKMFKFRSMYADAETKLASLLELNEIEGSMFKMREDPRITRIGKFIRKCSIDELPQLFNVLLGNMSLVGPRPALPREVATYSDFDKQRLLVIPGITGLWQVSGRNSLTFQEMVALDLKYIQLRSIRLDFKLLFRTIKEVISHQNAY
ncbi:sugar transferase [Carnobacterium mobile]|uniref:sugar transferase n=1 Tax=Carnobacterium mobile TaxID=2750 RepID=UPI000ACC7316|nr:sugar transferase [Carnobacterium mobile]